MKDTYVSYYNLEGKTVILTEDKGDMDGMFPAGSEVTVESVNSDGITFYQGNSYYHKEVTCKGFTGFKIVSEEV